ncbi:CRISPR-associated helicase Cas3' [Porphyromonas levii]|uniref:CRISPR-associated helicase Cas3' n=1 Tax=Porphyromonas levii TaxID=28114 RepID=UPI001B8BD880|nr:CRISPR-associated helicase Cas3' [Porphyromonas levii]MBR8732345.1 hypothetical protein [Porphyromonas levii]MBR8803584.1 hypothetical protein [Porphyromonas levii]
MAKEKSDVLAKPSGITLDVHTKNVVQEGALLLAALPATAKKYEEIVGKPLARRVELACRHHDLGKKQEQWQRACRKDYEAYLKGRESNPIGSFEMYEQVCHSTAGENLRRSGVRHEFHSLLMLQRRGNTVPQDWLKVAIVAHHRKLSFAHEDRWQRDLSEEVQGIWTDLRRLSNSFFDNKDESLEHIALKQYELSGPRSLLQLADHRASAKEEGKKVPDPHLFAYSFPASWSKRPVQKMVEEHWQDDLLLVRAPTGSGKTDAALLWASLQIQDKRADRLVIAMPTRFTSNALGVNVAQTLSETGLYHSSAWHNGLGREVESGERSLEEARTLHSQAYLLQTPVTVCTIDHLLSSLSLCCEDYHTITFALAGACLVIDEADFYDQFTEANILVLLEILRFWKVPVLLMSASLPDSSVKVYKRLGYSLEKGILEDKSDVDRVRFCLKEKRDVSNLWEMEDLLRLCISSGAAIIYANTVDRAQAYYQWFCDNAMGTEVVLYHSRFTEPDKMLKEEQLLQLLGKDAWRSGNAHGVAILTQIGEMSVNISAPLMISDLCPIDRLTQRAGRLCRFSEKIGELYIIRPQYKGALFPAPYYQESEDKKLMPNKAILKTDELVTKGEYSAQRLTGLLNQIYQEKEQYSCKAEANARELKELFQMNWLINPRDKVNVENGSSNFWRTRDMLPQCSVYTVSPPAYFRNYSEFREWESDVMVSLPTYIVNRTCSVFSTSDVTVGNDMRKLYILDSRRYTKERGVFFGSASSM